MMYALGRELEYYDMPQVRAVVRARRGAGLPAVGDRLRHRVERCLPHAGSRPRRGDGAEGRPRRSRGRKEGLTMFLTKKHLSRRTVLKGAGVTLALPLLDAMVPAATALAQTAASPKLRMGFFYLPHGAIMGNTSHGPQMDRWTPSGAGADFKLSPIVKSLEPYKRYVTSFGNLQNQAMVGGVHSLAPATWLSGTKPGSQAPPGRACPRRSIRWWRSTSVRTRRCRRSNSPPKPRSSRPRAAARRASTTRRSRFATSTRRCRWSTTRARCLRSCSARATLLRSAPRSRTRRRACSIASPAAPRALRQDLGASDRAVLDNYLETVREIERRVTAGLEPRPVGDQSAARRRSAS